MIHPAYFIAGLVLVAAVTLVAVAFGFNAAYKAYKQEAPPKLREVAGVKAEKEEELPSPISPSQLRRDKRVEVR